MMPVNTRDPAAAARAYLALEWPLAMGHRYRPQAGCTCGRVDCPVPGAHPSTDVRRLEEASLVGALENAPGAGLIAFTERFDAVLVPRQIGMAAMVQLDRDALPVPCLVLTPETFALLVLPATGRYALVHDAVEVRSGPDGWVPLPPSRGVRWDNPPWIEATVEARKLVNGDELRPALAECFKILRFVPGAVS